MFTLETILGSYIQYFLPLGQGNVVTESKLHMDSTETPSSNGDWTMTWKGEKSASWNERRKLKWEQRTVQNRNRPFGPQSPHRHINLVARHKLIGIGIVGRRASYCSLPLSTIFNHYNNLRSLSASRRRPSSWYLRKMTINRWLWHSSLWNASKG